LGAPRANPILRLEGTPLLVLIAAGVVVLGVVLYLMIDWIRAHCHAARVEELRRMARESWQQELDEQQQTAPRRPPANPDQALKSTPTPPASGA
jgi:hypothetical protein